MNVPLKTPQHPSAKAEARVTSPLPVPTECPYCHGPISLVNNAQIYGRSYGVWPWAYRCDDRECGSHIGLHPYTSIPLGTIANAELRAARMAVKVVFNPIWRNHGAYSVQRSKAYTWLAEQLGIPKAQCHIGWFDLAMCARATALCRLYKGDVATEKTTSEMI